MTSPALKNNFLPPGLVSNLQDVLASRKSAGGSKPDDDSATAENDPVDEDTSKPIILITNTDGIDSPGLSHLVDALVRERVYRVHVIAPQSDKSTSGHAVSLKETIEVASVDVNGAVAYEISGTPVDCVSLALSGALFSWSKPLLVISGINKGASCGHHMFYSGVIAGAREALLNGVPSISISLDWKKNEGEENHFKDAVALCLPIINATIRDLEKGVFPKGFSLDVQVPNSPSTSKGVKLTKRSNWKPTICWQTTSGSRNQAASRFSGQPGLGMQFAQLGRDASAAAAARRLSTQQKNLEVVESVGVAGKSDFKRTVKYFRAEMLDQEPADDADDLDFRALKNGFVSVTPLYPSAYSDPEMETIASNWISSALLAGQ